MDPRATCNPRLSRRHGPHLLLRVRGWPLSTAGLPTPSGALHGQQLDEFAASAGELDRATGRTARATGRFRLFGFGAGFFLANANNDGRRDLAAINGHVNDYRPAIPYAMPAQLFLGDGRGRLNRVSESSAAGACWQVPHVGRGMAIGDANNDCRLDLLFGSEGKRLVYLNNRGPAGHFVTLEIEGEAPRSNRDAAGARVILTPDPRRNAKRSRRVSTR